MSKRANIDGMVNEAGTFGRFCVVGGAGFLIDTLLALSLIAGGADPIIARAIAIPPALFVTYNLNRYWSFSSIPAGRYWTQLIVYLATQGFGAACNILIFVLGLSFLPEPANDPLVCIILASAVALIINYSGSRVIVFSTRSARH